MTTRSIPYRLGQESVRLAVAITKGVFFAAMWFVTEQVVPGLAHEAPWMAAGCTVCAVEWAERRQ